MLRYGNILNLMNITDCLPKEGFYPNVSQMYNLVLYIYIYILLYADQGEKSSGKMHVRAKLPIGRKNRFALTFLHTISMGKRNAMANSYSVLIVH